MEVEEASEAVEEDTMGVQVIMEIGMGMGEEEDLLAGSYS